MGNGWSECFNEIIRAYLDDGIVPKNGTVCADTTCRPFVTGGECQGPRVRAKAAGAHEGAIGFAAYRPLGVPF